MPSLFPLRFPDQLRQHLRASRKQQELTQAQLGALVGVSQARIAEIEANPGLVNFEQLTKLLSALGLHLVLQEGASSSALIPSADSAPAKASSEPKALGAKKKVTGKSSSHSSTTSAKKLPASNPGTGVESMPKRNLVARPKKGSW